MSRSILHLIIVFVCIASNDLFSQACQNNIQYPSGTITAPSNYDTVQVSNQNFPGDYALANQFTVGETYLFTSDAVDDMITLRSVDQSTVLAFGPQPLTYTISSDTAMNIHYNLPNCGTEVVGRVTKIIHQLIIEVSNVGINVAEPEATLDINGKLKLADDQNTPTEGMVRFNAETQDFEGFDGQKWRSFTQTSAIWGDAQAPIATTGNYFQASDGDDFDLFGTELDIDGDYAAITAYGQDIDDQVQQGSVYILKREGNTFTFFQKLVSPIGDLFDQYGQGGVDIHGNLLIIGNQNSEIAGSVGTAEVWDLVNGTWTYLTTISNNSGNNDFHFGRSVAINDQYAAVRNADFVNGVDEVLVYKKVGLAYQLIETIISPTPTGWFGAELEFYDNQLYICDPDFFSADVLGGRITIYDIDENDNISIVDSIGNVGEDTNLGDLFGREIDIDNDKMIVGSPGYTINGESRNGQAYIFSKENGSWVLEQTLQEVPSSGSDFGNSVSIYENQAVVSTSIFQGDPKAYVYKYEDEWKLEAILKGSLEYEGDFFGSGIEISNNLIMVGASRADINGNQNQGKIHIFCK